jgi:hypothetical protein
MVSVALRTAKGYLRANLIGSPKLGMNLALWLQTLWVNGLSGTSWDDHLKQMKSAGYCVRLGEWSHMHSLTGGINEINRIELANKALHLTAIPVRSIAEVSFVVCSLSNNNLQSS